MARSTTGARGIWLRKLSSFEEEARADREFWQRMSPDERVGVVEQLREEWWQDHGDGEQRLRRVVRVLDSAKSTPGDLKISGI